MLACKLYIGNLRGKMRNGKLIRYHEEMIIIEYEIRKFKLIENLSMNKIIQYQEVNQKLIIRELTIVNRQEPPLIITQNKTIMKLAVEFIKERKLNQQSYDEINHIRIYK